MTCYVCSLPEELPKKVDSITPYTMALIAKYIARHRLRETRLLDTIADFLVKKAEYLDSKVSMGQVLMLSLVVVDRTVQVCFSLTSGDPEAGVPVQQDELLSIQRAAVLLSAGGGCGAEGAQLATRHRQYPHVSVPAGSLPRSGAAPRLLLRLHQQCHQSVPKSSSTTAPAQPPYNQ